VPVRRSLNTAYKNHKINDEPWAIDSSERTGPDGISYEFYGMSYQQKLNSCNEAESIELEVRGRSHEAVTDSRCLRPSCAIPCRGAECHLRGAKAEAVMARRSVTDKNNRPDRA